MLLALGALGSGQGAAAGGGRAEGRRGREGEGQPVRAHGGGGGNTAVFVTANGVVVVDTKNPGWGQPILDKIKELTPKPVTTIINTHTHGDHVSGNVEFPATVDVVVQENTKANMEKMPIFKEHNNAGMAKRTFKDKMTIGKGADQIDLYYFGRGHTNGDAWVVFPALRVVHAGDIFAGKNAAAARRQQRRQRAADIARRSTKAHDGIKNVDTIITGHTPTQMTWADLKEYAEFNQDFLTWAQAGAEGRQDAGAAGRRGVEGSGKVQRLSQRGRESPDAAREPAAVRRARRSD